MSKITKYLVPLLLLLIAFASRISAQKTTKDVVYTPGVPTVCINGRVYVNISTGDIYSYKTGVGCVLAGDTSASATINPTVNTIPVKTGAATFGDSLASQSGSNFTINGNLTLSGGNRSISFGVGTIAFESSKGIKISEETLTGFTLTINQSGFTAPREYVAPDASGTIALANTTANTIPILSSTAGVFSNSPFSVSGGNTIFTGVMRGSDGLASAPTYSFNSQTGTGVYFPGTSQLGFVINTAERMRLTSNGLEVGANYLGFGGTIGNADVFLLRDGAASTLALRSGTNAQTFRVYNTFTDASNYERARFEWSGNTFTVGTQRAGTGILRPIYLDGSSVNFQFSGTTAWKVSTSGHFLAETDNTYDIGASGATRPRTGYFGTSISVGGSTSITATSVTSGADVNAASTGLFAWSGRGRFRSPLDGVITALNAAENDFSRFNLGGTSASFPAVARSTEYINIIDANGGNTSGLMINSGTPILGVLSNSATLDFPDTLAQTNSDLTITVTGAADGDVCSVGVPNGSTLTGSIYSCWVSAANTVTVRFSVYSATAKDPASGTFRVQVTKF